MTMPSVYPSGALLATRSAPMMPLAPGLFSIIVGCFSADASLSPTVRAMVSVKPPGV
jgi:hypothetical protein